MKTGFLSVALAASALTIAQANPRAVQHAGGGFHGGAVAHAAPVGRMPMRAGGLSSFHPMPARTYATRPVYPRQRYSSFGMRSSPSIGFNRSYAYSRGATITRSGPYTAATIRQPNATNRLPRFAHYRNPSGSGVWNQRNIGGQFRNGTNVRNTNNFRNSNNLRNGNNHLRGDWQKHVYAQRSGDWHRDWNQHSDHWWNGHRCCFINGSWVIFNIGFDPWWSSWGYPDHYFYDYGFPNDGYGSSTYGYNYPYSSNDPGYYNSGDYQGQIYYDQNSYPDDQSQGYYDSGVYQTDAYYDPNGYNDQSYSNYSVVVAAQERLAREGYYHGESDGAVGPQMRQALTAYQRSHGLRITGYLDGDTIALMGLR